MGKSRAMPQAYANGIGREEGETMKELIKKQRVLTRKGYQRRDPEQAYAKELGIKLRKLKALGGEHKLRSLSPEARSILLAPQNYGNSRTVVQGGLKARNMFTRIPGRLSQAAVK